MKNGCNATKSALALPVNTSNRSEIETTLRHKILALTFDVVRRTICGAIKSLLKTIIFELFT